jgi:hypothetical protein
MLKLCLQCLVSAVILCRFLLLFRQLWRAWRGDGLAAQFQRELRRRGLMTPSFRLPVP